MEKPTCKTCPYWEPGVNSWWKHLRLDFWLSVRGVGAKTAETLIENNVNDLDSLNRLQKSKSRIGDATAENVRSILEIGDTERICGLCRIRARASGTEFPTTWTGDWCGEHPDFPAWIESQRKQPSIVTCKMLADYRSSAYANSLSVRGRNVLEKLGDMPLSSVNASELRQVGGSGDITTREILDYIASHHPEQM